MGFEKKMKLGGNDGGEGVIGKGLERREWCGLGGRTLDACMMVSVKTLKAGLQYPLSSRVDTDPLLFFFFLLLMLT